MKTLFINACTRKESRTLELSNYLLDKIGGNIETINLYDLDLKPFTEEMINFRDKCIMEDNFDDSMFDLAKKFTNADLIVIGAPTWDLSFPSVLKLFIEHINVVELTFQYGPWGDIIPKCSADRLIYITTAGGPVNEEQSFGYIKALCNTFYGIKKLDFIKAENLDFENSNVEEIMSKTKEEIDKLF